MNGTLTDISALTVGHAHDLTHGLTGCTVVLCPPKTVGGVSQTGGAPGTRETDLLRPMHLIEHVNAIFLTGGSAFGLAVGDGVMRYLEEQDIGHQTPAGKVPIVSGAVLFDLTIGDASRRPDAQMGYAACQAASNAPVEMGCVGAGTGALVGAMTGAESATKSGIGSASLALGNGVVIAALFAVNALGDVYDDDGTILAGLRQDNQFVGTLAAMQQMNNPSSDVTNTVIGVVATNATLSKDQVNHMALMAQDGIARSVRPAHTLYDGDTIFGLATGEIAAEDTNFFAISVHAAEVVAAAIRAAVVHARRLGNIPAHSDLK